MSETDMERPVAEKAQEAARAAVAPRPARRYRAFVFQTYVLVAIVAFVVLAFLANTTLYFPIDLVITRTLQSYHSGWFNDLMQAVSLLGYSPQAIVIIGLLIVLLYVAGLRWEAVMGIFASAGVETLGLLVKFVVHRPRPAADLVHVVIQLHSYSFPSGHVSSYTAFYGFMWFLCFTLLKPSWGRTAALIIFGALVVLIGPSRIYLGEHWASDVLGGYLLGSLWLALSVYVYRWGKPRFFVHQPVAPEPERSGPQRV